MLQPGDNISSLPKIGPFLSRKLEKLGIKTIEDLFYHVPSRYVDYSLIKTISQVHPNEIVTIHSKVISLKNIYSKRGLKMQIGQVEDTTGKISVLWFNQPFLIKTLYPGKVVSLSGKVGFFNRRLVLSSPEYEILDPDLIGVNDMNIQTTHTGRLVPVYPETAGFSSKWLRTIINRSINLVEFKENLPKEILHKYKLVGTSDAFKFVHFPKDIKEAEMGRERLAFNEVLKLELQSEMRKIGWQKNITKNKLKISPSSIKSFIKSLPFKLTNSQIKSIDEIISDMTKNVPMNRLLEGDVGSGKTVVAASGIYLAQINGFKSVIMAPTQILATQHFRTLKNLFPKLKVGLITSSTKKTEDADIYIGTHALLHKKIDFSKVAFVVIDEQHRFGVEQRAHLVKSTGTPHILTMTATPIPRTVALTTYGDLDLSILTEMPKDRQKVTTWFVPETKRVGAYDWIKTQISNNKSQTFIVCPLIEESSFETMKDIKNVTQEFLTLKSIFDNFKLGLLHGKLKPQEKEKILNDFRSGNLDILVSTPVVEVGIDIPNATIMVVEAAERFGLAQLHQLRGRVGRGEKKSYCLLFSNIKYSRRLSAMEKLYSGFELAELDLKLRGPGEVFGLAQSGFPELKVASWSNYELIKEAKDAARYLIDKKLFAIETLAAKIV